MVSELSHCERLKVARGCRGSEKMILQAHRPGALQGSPTFGPQAGRTGALTPPPSILLNAAQGLAVKRARLREDPIRKNMERIDTNIPGLRRKCGCPSRNNRIRQHGIERWAQARSTRQQIQCTIHQEGFAHRDLKPSNIFVVSKPPTSHWWVKIGDFGVSNRVRGDVTAFRTRVGSFDYQAPKICGYLGLAPEYDKQVDIWSVGCVAYKLATKRVPFPNPRSLAEFCTGKAQLDFKPLPRNISEEGARFIGSLLVLAPRERPCAKTALETPLLFRTPSPTPSTLGDVRIKSEFEASNFIEIPELQDSRASCIISVMGAPGVGKTTFISDFNPDAKSMDICTRIIPMIGVHAGKLGGEQICLVDTPAFDHFGWSNESALYEIARWLYDSYRLGFRLSGIIYLHRVDDNQTRGSALKNLRIFRKLCGDAALPGVMLASTMWDKPPSPQNIRHEAPVLMDEELWREMIDGGSIIVRHDNGITSATRIIQNILSRGASVTLQIQEELAMRGAMRGAIGETGAAQELQAL